MPYNPDTKDRPFGIAGQPVSGDLFSDTAEVDPGQDINDVITHPGGPALPIDYEQGNPHPTRDVNDAILGSPSKFVAQRLGYKVK